jgi:hypothetical protein
LDTQASAAAIEAPLGSPVSLGQRNPGGRTCCPRWHQTAPDMFAVMKSFYAQAPR